MQIHAHTTHIIIYNTHTHTHTHIHVHTHTRTHTHNTNTHIYTCTHAHIHTHTQTYTHTYTHVLMYTCSHLYYIDQFGIKRISTDGSLDQQLVYFEVDEIKDLTVDVINNLLYWTVGTHIKYLNMTHWETLTQTQRDNVVPETFRSGFDGAVPHGISVINNTIYWTEDRQVSQENQEVTRPGAIYSLNLATSTAQRLLQDDNLSPRDLCTFLNTSSMFNCNCISPHILVV